MRINNSNGMPMSLNVQEKPNPEAVELAEGDEAKKSGESEASGSNTVRISMEGKQKLKESEDERDDLPPHIKDMIKAIERLIEMIEAAEEALLEAKEAEYPDEETKRDTLDAKQQYINSLEFARTDAVKVLQDAMKEAGLSEPGIIMDLMR